MIKEKRKHEVPQLNTTSTADISFMLLTFFLMTTSMDSDKGLPRQLPPIADEKQEQTTQEVKKRNIMELCLRNNNTLTLNGKPIAINKLRAEVEKFVENRTNSGQLPERTTVDIPLLGKCSTTAAHVIAIQAERKANYETYFAMQNEIMIAYNSLRNKLAKSRFGKSFAELSPEQADAIRTYYPQRISEAEPHRPPQTQQQ